MEQIILDAKSTLAQWSDSNNKAQVQRYLKNHQWLKTDVQKLINFANANQLVKMAITDTDIYGFGRTGMVYATGRGNLGISENFT